jgi:hypothetical protein
VLLTDGCDPPAGPPWDDFGTIHTLMPAPNAEELTVAVVAAEDACPSGVVHVRITISNVSDVAQTMEPGRGLLLHGGMNKYRIADIEIIDVPAGETITVFAVAYLPPAPPGRYTMVIEGYGPGGEIVLLDPATQ